ncbi:MAG: hypothetical protein ACRDTF_00740 [Pseudonocardiaceae bacterium]
MALAYRMADLDAAEQLTMRAVDLARQAGDSDLELVALSQLGLIRVGQGQTSVGFALIDEAMAAALAGESSSLDTVVYTCCDMLNACELASDVERAAQWCQVADDFVERYGCPFLYAECRIYYGSVLAPTEVESTPLIERISDEVYQRIRVDARDVLGPFTAADGGVEAPFGCHVLTVKPGQSPRER